MACAQQQEHLSPLSLAWLQPVRCLLRGRVRVVWSVGLQHLIGIGGVLVPSAPRPLLCTYPRCLCAQAHDRNCGALCWTATAVMKQIAAARRV
jgi:hypothetical protein